LACDSGARKKPSEERGPKLSKEIRQPQITTTKGVRQPTALIAFAVAPGTDIAAKSPSQTLVKGQHIGTAGHQPNE
jgi:hypothetical protein